jgi:hypothetical protein
MKKKTAYSNRQPWFLGCISCASATAMLALVIGWLCVDGSVHLVSNAEKRPTTVVELDNSEQGNYAVDVESLSPYVKYLPASSPKFPATDKLKRPVSVVNMFPDDLTMYFDDRTPQVRQTSNVNFSFVGVKIFVKTM